MSNFSNISNNAADFSNALTALADHTTGSIEKVIRKSCIDLYRSIVEKTPVDTGRAKASWGLSTHHTNDEASENMTPEEAVQVVSETMSDFKFTVHDDQVIIYNNLEYIEALENGHSQGQAPAGMVSISLVEFTAKFNNDLQDIEGLDPA